MLLGKIVGGNERRTHERKLHRSARYFVTLFLRFSVSRSQERVGTIYAQTQINLASYMYIYINLYMCNQVYLYFVDWEC